MVKYTLPRPPKENPGNPEEWLSKHGIGVGDGGWFEEAYYFLRYEYSSLRSGPAFYAVWLSVNKDDRGKLGTHADVANFLGVARNTIYAWRTKHKLDDYAELLRVLRMRGDRMAEVDRRVADAAASAEGKAVDRRLFYERAGVLQNVVSLDDQRTSDRLVRMLDDIKAAGPLEGREA